MTRCKSDYFLSRIKRLRAFIIGPRVKTFVTPKILLRDFQNARFEEFIHATRIGDGIVSILIRAVRAWPDQ